MENEKMGAIDRTLFFLAKATYANHGLGADFRVVPVDKDEKET